MSVQLSASVVPQPDALWTGRTIHPSQSTDPQVGRSCVVNLPPVSALESYDHWTHEDHMDRTQKHYDHYENGTVNLCGCLIKSCLITASLGTCLKASV